MPLLRFVELNNRLCRIDAVAPIALGVVCRPPAACKKSGYSVEHADCANCREGWGFELRCRARQNWCWREPKRRHFACEATTHPKCNEGSKDGANKRIGSPSSTGSTGEGVVRICRIQRAGAELVTRSGRVVFLSVWDQARETAHRSQLQRGSC